MEFSEKFSKLLALTQTQSTQLAKAVFLDPSQISRMKTGMRGKPRNQETLKQIADYLATHCTSDYRLSALCELTGDSRVMSDSSEGMCSQVIYRWLSSDDDIPDNSHQLMSKFLQKVDDFSLASSKSLNDDIGVISMRGDDTLVSYTNNKGKRQAVLEMLDYLLANPISKSICIFTDEDMDWIYEDTDFVRHLANGIYQLATAGYHFIRIAPPEQSLSYTLWNIDRWLPAYMLGSIREYYYPSVRDNLHRRTIFVSPCQAVVCSHSLADQKQSRQTLFCIEDSIVDISYQEFGDIQKLCKPMMRVYTAADSEEMFRSRVEITSILSHGVYRTAALSIVTLPIEILERIQYESSSPLARMMLKNHITCLRLVRNALYEYPVDDIMTLAEPDDVRNGKVLIPSTVLLPDGPYYYTQEEYKLHLEKTVELMEMFPNYNVYLTKNEHLKGVSLICKYDQSVLLIKGNTPFAVLEITEQRFASNFSAYLRQIVSNEKAKMSRADVLKRLKAVINILD